MSRLLRCVLASVLASVVLIAAVAAEEGRELQEKSALKTYARLVMLGEEIKLLGCSSSEVFLSRASTASRDVGIRDLVHTGDVVVYDDEDSADACEQCARLIRTVAGVGAAKARSWGGSMCPDGHECAVVVTRDTMAEDIYEEDTLKAMHLDNFAVSSMMSGRAYCRQEAPLTRRSSVRQTSGFPAACSGWLRSAQSPSQCPFNACPAPICYSCELRDGGCNSGCGSGISAPLVPDSLPGLFNFEDSCCHHDYCYSAGGVFTQKQCDDEFQSDLLRSCRSVFFFVRPLCILSANLYYQAVATFGETFFD
eukprot:CAMPEP_0198732940 /NCGR_PEP_ID=MMETSP1475-20131203/41281_1 /TAXON_ID= ORGANISM="Unidentified sp., Strain CCMP1999" /NCGR_SAMPLE_ID=MMETSP1475 /ASSEMBLY_ACC=CAM_ASM_001111 /LENGTH=308 /DNA_ID=CAMNT_0044496149 /DNA_START=67 /DNA_END=990 /DNA_ORIENTATION=-